MSSMTCNAILIALETEFAQLISPDSPIQQVGTTRQRTFAPAEHLVANSRTREIKFASFAS